MEKKEIWDIRFDIIKSYNREKKRKTNFQLFDVRVILVWEHIKNSFVILVVFERMVRKFMRIVNKSDVFEKYLQKILLLWNLII